MNQLMLEMAIKIPEIDIKTIMDLANHAKDKLNKTLDQYHFNKQNQEEQKGQPKNYSDCQYREEGEFFVEFIKLMAQVSIQFNSISSVNSVSIKCTLLVFEYSNFYIN